MHYGSWPSDNSSDRIPCNPASHESKCHDLRVRHRRDCDGGGSLPVNQTDQPLAIYWLDEDGREDLIFELEPRMPRGSVYLPDCDPRGLVARTVSGDEFARREGPTCGGWVVTEGD